MIRCMLFCAFVGKARRCRCLADWSKGGGLGFCFGGFFLGVRVPKAGAGRGLARPLHRHSRCRPLADHRARAVGGKRGVMFVLFHGDAEPGYFCPWQAQAVEAGAAATESASKKRPSAHIVRLRMEREDIYIYIYIYTYIHTYIHMCIYIYIYNHI